MKAILPNWLAPALAMVVLGCAPAVHSPLGAATDVSTISGLARRGHLQGYGQVSVSIGGLPFTRSVQALGSGASTVVLRVRKNDNSGDVTDVAGQAAIYRASAWGGSATFALPGLPSTSTNPATLGTASGSPYIFQMRCYNSSKTFPTPVTSGGRTLSSYVSPSDVTENLSDPTILASGEALGNVVAGLPETVAITSYAHVGANLNTAVSPPVSLVSLTAVNPDSSGMVHIRLTDVEQARLGRLGSGLAHPAIGSFTIVSPQVGDQVTVQWTDLAGNFNSSTTTVASGDTADTVSSALANNFNAPAKANYTLAPNGSGTVNITSIKNNGVWNSSAAKPLTATVVAPPPGEWVTASASISGGDLATAAQGTIVFAGTPVQNDRIVFAFSDAESPPASVSYTYTVTASDATGSLAGLVDNLVADLISTVPTMFSNGPGATYQASSSNGVLTLKANAVGQQYNVSALLPTAVTTHATKTSVSTVNLAGGDPLTMLRAVLTYASPYRVPAVWTVGSLACGTGPSLTAAATSDLLATPNAAGSLLLDGTTNPAADTVQYLDIPVADNSHDGVWNFTIHGPGPYLTFQVLDLETGSNTSTPIMAQ